MEQMNYDMFSKNMSKEESLQIIINTVEGDYTQLSQELSEIAERQTSSKQWNEWCMEQNGYAKGGSTYEEGGEIEADLKSLQLKFKTT